ncbi:MAG: tetratricopeptide repeat protein [Candidatus Margulisbacteria bacterium]|nr:tetratricopeptide repeat protein [Candidatus Margulisiibacteriota bacterium]
MKELAEIRKKLNENPGDPLALRGAARHYLAEGYYKQAQATYLSAFESSPRLLPGILLDYEARLGAEPQKIGPRLSLSGLLLSIGESDAAILELEELLEANPQNVESYNVLGRIYIRRNRIDDAIALLERSIAAGVRDVNLTETLAAAYLEKGRMNEAIKFYEEILAQKPGDKQTLRSLGELYTRIEDYSRAAKNYAAMFSDDPEVVREVIQRLEELLKKVEGSIEIREILSDIYMKVIDPEAAVAKLREILRLESTKLGEAVIKLKAILKNYPNHPTASLALAEALYRQGNYSEAVELYHQLLRVKPDLIEEIIKGYHEVLDTCPDQVLARAYLGEALLAKNLVLEALDEFGKMVEADPTVADTVIKKCREVLRAQPQLLPAHTILGRAYLAKGDYQRAAVEGEGAIAIDKNLTSAYLLLGEAYSRLNLLRKASQTLRTALMLDPADIEIHEKYRQVREKEIELEIEGLKTRLHEDQWKLSLHLDLAKLYLDKGNREEAVRESQLAQKDQAKAAAAFSLLGGIYRADGRFDLAAEQYNRALAAAPAPDQAKLLRFNLGSTCEAQGDIRKAIKIYETILQEDIDFGGLKKRIKNLKTTTLLSMRNHSLMAVIADFPAVVGSGKKDIIAIWGRDPRLAGRARKEEMNVSFGQEHNQEGFEFFMKGMFPAAEEELLLAVGLDRRFGCALSNLGVVLAKAGKLEEARARLAEAVQVDPASSVFYNNLGVVYFLLGKTDLAATALEKSFALDPEASAICLNLGDLYYLKKDAQKALELYRRVGEFDVLSDLARRRLFCKAP